MLLDKLSKVFGAENMVMESALKNPNQFRTAVLKEALEELPVDKRKEFANSKEAKEMVNSGYLTPEDVDDVAKGNVEDSIFSLAACHMAKESDDPLWDELVKCRAQERRLLNDIFEKYEKEAKPIADNAKTDFIEACIPEYFRK